VKEIIIKFDIEIVRDQKGNFVVNGNPFDSFPDDVKTIIKKEIEKSLIKMSKVMRRDNEYTNSDTQL